MVLQESTDWENYPLDEITDQLEAFDGVENDSIKHALWYFVDEFLTQLTAYKVPMDEVRQRLAKITPLGDAILMEFVPSVKQPLFNQPFIRSESPLMRAWLDDVLY